MRQRLPPLNTLRLFEASARLLSFKNAAEELALTPSAVSHGIQTLEGWLQRPLFVRTPRGLVLSEAGEAYYPIVREALALLAEGSERIREPSETRRLTISVAPTFAARWLLPRLPRFRQRHPTISVVIDTAHARVDLTRGGVDLAIRMGRGGWQGLFAQKLVDERLVPVCAPSLRERLRQLDDITQAPLIHLDSVREDWAAWASGAGRAVPDPAHGLRVDTLQMAFDAAVRGLGVVIGRRPLVDEEIVRGELVEIGEPTVAGATAYWLVGREERADDPLIQAFRHWLDEELTALSPAGP